METPKKMTPEQEAMAMAPKERKEEKEAKPEARFGGGSETEITFGEEGEVTVLDKTTGEATINMPGGIVKEYAPDVVKDKLQMDAINEMVEAQLRKFDEENKTDPNVNKVRNERVILEQRLKGSLIDRAAAANKLNQNPPMMH